MRSELWSNVLFETLNEATLILDARFQIVAMNPASEALFEVSSLDALGRGIKFLTGREIPSSEIRQSRELLLRGGVLRGRAWYQKPNGKRFRAEFVAKAVLRTSIPENQKITAAIIHGHLEGLVATVLDVTEAEARDTRQVLLVKVLQALTDASSLEEIYSAVLEMLTGEHGVDSVVLREKQTDGYRVVASRGSYQAMEFAQFQPSTEAIWLRDETDSIIITPEINDSYVKQLFNAGFVYVVGVGQRSAGRLVGSLTLVYRHVPVVDLNPSCHKLRLPLEPTSSVDANALRLKPWRAQTVPCVKPPTKPSCTSRWSILRFKPRIAPPPAWSCITWSARCSRWSRRLARMPKNLLV